MTTIAQIRQANAEAGNCFFSRSTMRVWGSQIIPTVNEGPGGVYFLTSEYNYNKTDREYSVRKFNPETGDVRSAYYGRLYDTKRYKTRREARTVAQVLAQVGEPVARLKEGEQS